jgi:hypothetical protein
MSDSPSILPKSLRFFANRINGFSKTTVQFSPTNAGPWLPAGSPVEANLPSNALVDLRSLVMRFDVTATAATSNSGTSVANNVVPPRHSTSFIQRFDVSLNNQPIALQSITDYGSLKHIKKNLSCGGNKLTELSLFEGGVVPTPTSTSTFGTKTYLITDWEGIFGCDYVRYLPLNVAGQMKLSIQFAPNSILSVFNAVNSGASYTVSNVKFYIDCLSFASPFLDAAIRQQLETGGAIEVPFKDWGMYAGASSVNAGTLTWNVNAGSLDNLYATLRPAGFESTDAVYEGAAVGVVPYHYFTSDGTSTQFQYQINSVQYPQFPVDYIGAYHQMKNSVDGDSQLYTNSITSPNDWKAYNFVFPLSLELLGENPADKSYSGLSTLGTNVPITLKWSGGATSTGCRAYIFGEMTRKLKLYAGQVATIDP